VDVDVRRRAQVEVIRLRGQLRLGEAVDALRAAIDEAVADGNSKFVVNLAEVPTIDSSGIGLLVKAMASAKQRGGTLKLVNPSKFAIQVLRLVGVLNLFEVFDDENAAVDSFG
jgi:anti-sigma B factor antagonist